MPKFPESATNFQPTEDDILSGSPTHKRVKVTIVADIDIPLDAIVQNGVIILDTGREIMPVLGLYDATNDRATARESAMRNYGADALEYLDCTIVPAVETCDECDGNGEKAYGQDGSPYEPCRKCKGTGEQLSR